MRQTLRLFSLVQRKVEWKRSVPALLFKLKLANGGSQKNCLSFKYKEDVDNLFEPLNLAKLYIYIYMSIPHGKFFYKKRTECLILRIPMQLDMTFRPLK